VEDFNETAKTEYESQFSYDDLQYCLEQLSDNQRIVFNLYAIDEYKPREIAKILDINDDTVRTLIHRSKLKLQKLLTNLEKKRRMQ
ncbi:MAG: sigma-70 family RNA polymerase sigma factor, partial [Bacteroidales bacterium]|nr:sigma-70 family RNA polymerase sigma factor [Bacteroidales bacterium]